MAGMATTHVDGTDREALQRKYRLERDKRLRPDGNDQYLEPTGRFATLLDDPYTERVERAPQHRNVDVAIIGAGFSGLVMGARLRQAGIDDLCLIEGGGDVGGAWYWNRYPGAMCDTAAMIYLPLLEETGHMPSRKYTYAPEIFGHAQRIARTFNLYEAALFSTEVTALEWQHDVSRWRITTNRGDELMARFVSVGTGPLHRPKLPGIPGIDSFGGHCFHTSRWDYLYTGGDALGAPLEHLATKRVGIIGTGATSIQCIPTLSRDAGELYVFQRTPSSIDVRNNHEIDAEWFDTLGPGWQRKWLENFCTLQTGGFADEDLVQDGWTDISKRIRDRVVQAITDGGEVGPALMLRAYEDSDDDKMNEIRARVNEIVNDPTTGEGLKPWYRQLCKRPCFHDEYLLAYNRENTHLVDTDGRGVERIDESGVWVGGVHYELDCIVFASGFEVGTEQSRRSGFETVGRDGLTMTQHWAGGMRSLHGLHMHGFPNAFLPGVVQAASLISNVTHNYTESSLTVAAVIKHALEIGADEVEATAEAEENWVALLEGPSSAVFGNPECTPGYYNNEGQPLQGGNRIMGTAYPQGPIAFFQYIDRWRTNGEFEGLEFRSAGAPRHEAS